jgi:hypothetical protein
VGKTSNSCDPWNVNNKHGKKVAVKCTYLIVLHLLLQLHSNTLCYAILGIVKSQPPVNNFGGPLVPAFSDKQDEEEKRRKEELHLPPNNICHK